MLRRPDSIPDGDTIIEDPVMEPFFIAKSSSGGYTVYERVNKLYEEVENALFVSHQDTIRAFTFYKTKAKFFNLDKPVHCGIQEINGENLLTHTY